jgi:predicted nucleotidyltransferase
LHRLTDLGSQYATKGLRRITAKTKDRLIQGVLDRAREIGRRPDFTFELDLLILFGSAMRDDLPDYGDVDLAMSIEFKQTYPDRLTALEAQQDITGVPYYDLNNGLPEIRIGKLIRQRSAFIHLHVLSEGQRLQVPHRVL